MTIPARYTLTEAHFRIAELEEQLETAAQLLRYPASADGPGDKFVQDCRAWLDAYGGAPNPARRPDVSEREGIDDSAPQAARGVESGSSRSGTSDPASEPKA